MRIPTKFLLTHDLRAASSLVGKGGFCKGVMMYKQVEGRNCSLIVLKNMFIEKAWQ